MAEPKVATCCYCNRRTVLRPTAADGHALACASCGAPLTRMKVLRPAAAAQAAGHVPAGHPVPIRPEGSKAPKPPRQKRDKRSKKKSFFHKVLKEVWDEVEDIFD